MRGFEQPCVLRAEGENKVKGKKTRASSKHTGHNCRNLPHSMHAHVLYPLPQSCASALSKYVASEANQGASFLSHFVQNTGSRTNTATAADEKERKNEALRVPEGLCPIILQDKRGPTKILLSWTAVGVIARYSITHSTIAWASHACIFFSLLSSNYIGEEHKEGTGMGSEEKAPHARHQRPRHTTTCAPAHHPKVNTTIHRLSLPEMILSLSDGENIATNLVKQSTVGLCRESPSLSH